MSVGRLQSALYTVFFDRLSVRKELGELEGLERDLSFKIGNKQRSMQRLATFTGAAGDVQVSLMTMSCMLLAAQVNYFPVNCSIRAQFASSFG